MKLLNIGCGSVFHQAWVNLDLTSASECVQACDIRKGFPFPTSTFEACYSSHLLEHFTLEEAKSFINECFRVLKPGGVCRVVVPDLEEIARTYLDMLEKAKAGDQRAIENYEWMLLELFDQVARTYSGGKIYEYLHKPKLTNKEFISSRIGLEAEKFWTYNVENQGEENSWNRKELQKPSLIFRKIREKLAGVMVALIAGQETLAAYEEGLFRSKGEIHRWMYDSFSLKNLLKQSGFSKVDVYTASNSLIPNFNEYELDTLNNQVRKPDSIYIEGIKL
jgi:predicted SAM-dependent methyltransferase